MLFLLFLYYLLQGPLSMPVTASASCAAENDSCSGMGGYIAVDVLLDSIRKEMKKPKAFSIRREDQLLPCAT